MIRFAVIGLGYWGPNLARNLAEADGGAVTVCCDTDARRLERMGRLLPSAAPIRDADAVFARDDVDAVAIATPPRQHYALARRALESGKHVLVEKPFTRSAAEGAELVALARQRSLVLMVDHTFVFHPAVEKIRDVLQRGELGEPCYYDSTRINLGLCQSDVSVLWDLAPHDISIMDHLIDRPVRWVQAAAASHTGNGVHSMAYVTIQFADNVLGHFHVNWLSPVKSRQIIIGGTRRMLIYDDNQVTEKVKIYDRGVEIRGLAGVHHARMQYRLGDMYAPTIPNDEALRRMSQHLIHCIREGQQPVTDGEAGLRVVRIVEAAELSIQSGQRVFLRPETCDA